METINATSRSKNNYKPLLNAGFHEKTLEEAKKLCVDNFIDNNRRKKIWNNFRELINILKSINLKFDIWLDGSFLTDKPDPGDADLVLIFSPEEINNLTQENQLLLSQLFGQNRECKLKYLCDAYPLMLKNGELDFNDKAYWRGVFGFDREDKPKGIITIKDGELK